MSRSRPAAKSSMQEGVGILDVMQDLFLWYVSDLLGVYLPTQGKVPVKIAGEDFY